MGGVPILIIHRAKTHRNIFSYFSELGVLCAFARVRAYLISSLSRQDAKIAKIKLFFLCALCARLISLAPDITTPANVKLCESPSKAGVYPQLITLSLDLPRDGEFIEP